MNRSLRIALPIAAVVLAVLGYAGYQYFIVVESPDEVTTDAALEQLTDDLADASAETDLADDVAADDVGSGVAGTWIVDDDFGDFSFENASGSFAGFRVDKELFVGGVQVAVGRSGDVTGSITIADGEVSNGEIVVDMSTLESDIPARTGAVLDAVEAGTFETATFAITTAAVIDTAALEAGSTVAADIVGDLTIAGVTNSVTVAAEASVVEAGIALIVGSTDLTWADFDIETPSSTAGEVADDGTLEFQLVVRLG